MPSCRRFRIHVSLVALEGTSQLEPSEDATYRMMPNVVVGGLKATRMSRGELPDAPMACEKK